MIDHGKPAPSPTPQGLGLYVHIPFCPQKCPYCDFVSGQFDLSSRLACLEALEREIRTSSCAGRSVNTVYFGGGTPTELSIHELEGLVGAVQETFVTANACEWSIECNPETVTSELLDGMSPLGFNRISLGIQSFQNHYLQLLGRTHTAEDSLQSYRLVRAAEFGNVNLDLLFGLPGQSLDHWKLDLDQALALDPEHLSLYSLTIEEGTEFGERRSRGELEEIDEEGTADMYELALDLTREFGFDQYELSSFARPGRECLHNLGYWNYLPYLGFGLGAASFLEGTRWTNTPVLRDYLRDAPNGEISRATEKRLEGREALGEELMLGLHTQKGVSLGSLSLRYGCDVGQVYADSFQLLSGQGLIELEDDHARLTRKGKLVAAEVCAEFLPLEEPLPLGS